jgi:hypothetical protein
MTHFLSPPPRYITEREGDGRDGPWVGDFVGASTIQRCIEWNECNRRRLVDGAKFNLSAALCDVTGGVLHARIHHALLVASAACKASSLPGFFAPGSKSVNTFSCIRSCLAVGWMEARGIETLTRKRTLIVIRADDRGALHCVAGLL